MESLECMESHTKKEYVAIMVWRHGVESSGYDDLFCLNWAKDVYQDGMYPRVIAGNSVDQHLYRLGFSSSFFRRCLQLKLHRYLKNGQLELERRKLRTVLTTNEVVPIFTVKLILGWNNSVLYHCSSCHLVLLFYF